jgi:DNA-binding HxlR family transcriptional regulator
MELAKRKSRREVLVPARKPKSHCPIHFALNTFGDAWSLLIVRGISTNILADRLARLESEGIITRDVIHTADARTSYRLTDKGLDLMPMLLEMIAWSAKYDRKTAAAEDFVRRVRRDRDALVKELRAGLATSHSVISSR